MPQGDTFRLHRELLGLLWGIRDAFPVEKALSQDSSDEPKFVRVINVCVGGGIPDGWDNPGESVSILLVVGDRNTIPNDSR